MTQANGNQKVVAYRRGSLDAFIAAFIYWKLFKSTLGQRYYSVDPFTNTFLRDMTERQAPQFVISIGTNLEKVFGHSGFFSYEVSETFPVLESHENWTYVREPGLSLTQLILRELNSAGYITASSPEFVTMNQFLKFSDQPGYVIDPKVAEELAVLLPNMLPDDFSILDKMLFSPTSAMAYFGKKSVTDVSMEHFHAQCARALQTTINCNVSGQPLLMVNSSLYDHPSVISRFQDNDDPVMVYEITAMGIRGKLIAPSASEEDFNALTFFPIGRVSGDRKIADVLLPLTTFAALF